MAAVQVALTKKDADVVGDWGQEQTDALNALNLAIATAGAITPYQPDKQLILQVDACRLGCAAMLGQLY